VTREIASTGIPLSDYRIGADVIVHGAAVILSRKIPIDPPEIAPAA